MDEHYGVSPFGPETPLAPDESPCFPYDPMLDHYPWISQPETFTNPCHIGESVVLHVSEIQAELKRKRKAAKRHFGFA